MENTFYLFGQDACRAYDNGGIQAVLKCGEIFDSFWFIEGYTKSWELAEAMGGWLDYITITKDEYFDLNFAHKAKTEKIGNEPDTSICFQIQDGVDDIYLFGNFYGDTFEFSSDEFSSPESEQFAKDWHEQIENFLLERYTEEERRA